MRATGIVRRIDDLGRLVIPSEVRTRLGLKPGSPVEMLTMVSEDTGLECLVVQLYGDSQLKAFERLEKDLLNSCEDSETQSKVQDSITTLKEFMRSSPRFQER